MSKFIVNPKCKLIATQIGVPSSCKNAVESLYNNLNYGKWLIAVMERLQHHMRIRWWQA